MYELISLFVPDVLSRAHSVYLATDKIHRTIIPRSRKQQCGSTHSAPQNKNTLSYSIIRAGR